LKGIAACHHEYTRHNRHTSGFYQLHYGFHRVLERLVIVMLV